MRMPAVFRTAVGFAGTTIFRAEIPHRETEYGVSAQDTGEGACHGSSNHEEPA